MSPTPPATPLVLANSSQSAKEITSSARLTTTRSLGRVGDSFLNGFLHSHRTNREPDAPVNNTMGEFGTSGFVDSEGGIFVGQAFGWEAGCFADTIL
jgi:hypothetical protein